MEPRTHVTSFPRHRRWNQRPPSKGEEFAANKLLGVLAANPRTLERLRHHLVLVHLERGDLLHDCRVPPANVFFLTSAVASLYCTTVDGCTSELAVVGNEGMIGVSVITGGETSASQAIVVSPGAAWRLPGKILRQESAENAASQRLLLRYLHVLMTDISHGSVCDTHHCIRQRFCRLLLQMLDRAPSNELDTTHAMIANRLGVRRESISEVARTLQSDGLIRYRRGRIYVLDRVRLALLSCECYELIKDGYDRLFAGELRQAVR